MGRVLDAKCVRRRKAPSLGLAIDATNRRGSVREQGSSGRMAQPLEAPVDLEALIGALSRGVHEGVDVRLEIEPNLRIRGPASTLLQPLLELYRRVCAAAPAGARLTLGGRRVAPDDPRRAPSGCTLGGWIELRVDSDREVGLEADLVTRLGEAVRGHQGRLEVEVQPGHTRVDLLLPGVETPGPALPARPAGPSRVILVVEDDAVLRRSVTRMLRHLGHRVLTAVDGRDAVDVYRQHVDEVEVVLLDVNLPHMNGAQAAAELRAISPKVKILLSSGHEREKLEPGVDGFLSKPYTLKQLVDALAG